MGIHAKSLNQLAHELETQSRAAHEALKPHPVPVATAPSDLAKELAEFKKFVAGLGSPNPAGGLKKDATPEPALPVEAAVSTAFYMDSSLGTRTRPAQFSEARKREAELRLYSGFASRSDITGKD